MMMNKEQLRMELTRIRENEYNLKEGEKAADYLPAMLENIGDTDGELRDRLIYLTFAYWIEVKGYFSKEELSEILKVILSDNYLFHGIGKAEDDSVFKRSFSALLINPILCVHYEDNFLSEEELLWIKDRLFRLMREENDLRGFVEEKGWAHSLAHLADAFNILWACLETKENMCVEFMELVKEKLLSGSHFLHTDEDERLINSIYGFMEDKLIKDEYLVEWIESLAASMELEERMERFKAKANVKSFIRSLYFRLIHNEFEVEYAPEILNAILALDKKITE